MTDTPTWQETVDVSGVKCWCGMPFAMPSSLLRSAKNDGTVFYCPLGHQNIYRESTADKLKKKVAELEKKITGKGPATLTVIKGKKKSP